MSSEGSVRCSTCRSSSYCPRTASRPIARRSSAFFPEHARKTSGCGDEAPVRGHRRVDGLSLARRRSEPVAPGTSAVGRTNRSHTALVVATLLALQSRLEPLHVLWHL